MLVADFGIRKFIFFKGNTCHLLGFSLVYLRDLENSMPSLKKEKIRILIFFSTS